MEPVLKQALEARINEVQSYQININNYTLAIEEINNLSAYEQEELSGFKQQLEDLLSTEILEQKKAKIMKRVIERQLEDL